MNKINYEKNIIARSSIIRVDTREDGTTRVNITKSNIVKVDAKKP